MNNHQDKPQSAEHDGETSAAVLGMRCYRLDECPAPMKATYARLALVAHRRHIDKYADDDGETLLVLSNWLLWQECLAEGRHAVHIDRGLLDWEDAYDLGNNLHIRASDWMFLGGLNATKFRGVSLGAKMSVMATLLLSDHERLTRALETLVRAFRPREIVFYDLMTDFGYLDITECLAVTEDVAGKCGIAAVDATDPLGDGEPGFPMSRYGYLETPAETGSALYFRQLGRRAYVRALSLCGRIRRLFGRRPSVFLLVSHLNGIPLLEAFRERHFHAQVLARWWPNKRHVTKILHYLWRGIVPVDGGAPALSADDRARLAKIRDTFDNAWRGDAPGAEGAIRRYIRDTFLNEQALAEAALEVVWLESILERFRPSVIVTDGLRNFVSLTALALGKQKGMTTIAMWHATLSQKSRLILLGGDPRTPSLADKCFTWGSFQERWLKDTGAVTHPIRVGHVVSAKHSRRSKKSRAPDGRNALVLQYILANEDYRSPCADEYFYFVEVVRMLRKLSFREIRIKLHPGAPKEKYYRRIADVFGLDCEIVRTGGLAAHFEWADIAIGPASSGAMLEFTKVGVPFFPVLLEPHSMDMFEDDHLVTIFNDLEVLRTSLAKNAAPDCKDIAEALTSNTTISNPAQRVWEALRQELDIAV